MDIPGSTGRNSRTVHVVRVESLDGVPSIGTADRWSTDNLRPAVCGQQVHPARGSLQPASEVCLKCRKALNWPFVVTWESHGHTFTTDFGAKR